MNNINIEELKQRLTQLETKLKDLLKISSRDLEIAKRLQALVVKNRLPSIPGLNLLARHFSGSDMSAEAFDIIPTKDFREIFVVVHWSESFGLSSVLLQAMVQLQTRAALDSHPEISADDLFDEIQNSLKEYDKNSHFRLSILRFDIHSLKFSLTTKGFFPWFILNKGTWSSIGSDTLENVNPEHLSAVQDDKYFSYNGILEPGSKLFFISTEWNFHATSIKDFLEPLQLKTIPSKASLLETLNNLMQKCDNKIKSDENKVDLSAIALEIDERKIHLA